MALKASADTRRHGGAGTSLHADHLGWTRWTREVVGRFLTKHSPDLPKPTSGSPSYRRTVQTVVITGAFLAESAAVVNNKLHVTGGVLEHITVDPTQKQVVTPILVLLTQTQTGETIGNVEIKVRPPIGDADPLVITGPLPEEAARGEMGFACCAIQTNIWHHFEGRWVVEASAGGNTVSLPLNVHHTH